MEEKIIEIIEQILGGKKLGLTPEASIIDDFRLDSLQTINFILNLENEFDIILDFENFDFSLLSSVNRLADYIRREMDA